MQTTNTQSVTVDVRKRNSNTSFVDRNATQPTPQFVQGDTNILEVEVKENGYAADLSNVGRVVVNFKRKDGDVTSRLAEKYGNSIRYTLGTKEMERSGIADVEIQFFSTDNTERISTLRFKVNVTPQIGSDEVLEKDPAYTALQELFIEVEDVGERASNNADYAKQQGDYAKAQAVKLVNLDGITEAAEAATTQAKTATTNAQTQASHAKQQGDYAKEQADLSVEQYNRLKDTDVGTLSAQLADTTDRTEIIDVYNLGIKYDGTTDNAPLLTTIVNAAKRGERQAKIFHFRQNSGATATYYFSNGASILGGNRYISCEQDVKLKVNSMNGQIINIKNVGMYPLSIYVVDRDNTVIIYPNEESLYKTALFGADDSEIGVKQINYLDDTKLSKRDYFLTNAPSTNGTALWDSTQKIFKGNTGSENKDQFVTVGTDIGQNNFFNCTYFTYQNGTPDTNVDMRYSVLAIIDDSNFIAACIDTQGNYIRNTKVSGVNTVTTKALGLNDAYTARYGCLLSIFFDTSKKAKVYVNGALVDEFESSLPFTKAAFGINQITAAGSGINKHFWGNVVGGNAQKIQATKPVKVAVFGDSLSEAEGVEPWANLMKKRLEGSNGFSDIQVTNKAKSGQTAAQQLTIMQGMTDLNTFDVVMILVGTNNIQQKVDARNTTEVNMRSMIQLAKSNGCKVIVGIPPMFISKALAGSGFDTANFHLGSETRGRIIKVIAEEGAFLADTLSEVGLVNQATNPKLLRDNIHLTQLTSIMIAKCFSRTLIEIVNGTTKQNNIATGTPSIENFVPELQNGWVAQGGLYVTPKVIKEGNTVTVRGIIKSGTVAGTVLLFTLPAGFRPKERDIILCPASTGTWGCEIRENGEVVMSINPIGTPSWISLKMTFRTD